MKSLKALFLCPIFETWNDVGNHLNNPLWVTSFFGTERHFARDRTNTLNKFGLYNICELPTFDYKITPHQREFSDLVNERARYLIDNIDRPITVLWSGGVDSTMIMCAMIANGIPKDKLRVYCTMESVWEAPGFMEFVLRNGYTVHPTSAGYFYRDFDRDFGDTHLISGDASDLLFGSVKASKMIALQSMPWVDGWRFAMHEFHKDFPTPSFDTFDYIQEWMNRWSGWEIKTFGQFLWWNSYALQYDGVIEHFRLEFEGKYADHQESFFETPEFNQWALNDFPNRGKHNQWFDHRYYKKHLKDYIQSVWKNDDYHRYKGKCGSWSIHYNHNYNIGKLILRDEEGYKTIPYKGYKNDINRLCDASVKQVVELLKPYRKAETL